MTLEESFGSRTLSNVATSFTIEEAPPCKIVHGAPFFKTRGRHTRVPRQLRRRGSGRMPNCRGTGAVAVASSDLRDARNSKIWQSTGRFFRRCNSARSLVRSFVRARARAHTHARSGDQDGDGRASVTRGRETDSRTTNTRGAAERTRSGRKRSRRTNAFQRRDRAKSSRSHKQRVVFA